MFLENVYRNVLWYIEKGTDAIFGGIRRCLAGGAHFSKRVASNAGSLEIVLGLHYALFIRATSLSH